MKRSVLKLLPRCGRCLREVERLVEYYDEFCQRLVFVAVCHGERERVDIHVDELESGTINLSAGVAFRAPPQLPAGGSQ